MSTAEDDIIVSICANCGKEGDDVNNICNKCKLVKYCNAACKKKHRHKHKKDCEEHIRLATERAAELHDKELFKQPPKEEDRPICFLLIPTLPTGWRYKSCCGKLICSGCIQAPLYDNQGNRVDNQKSAFCRIPTATSQEESTERYKKRVEAGDPTAMYNLGCDYRDGRYGLSRDYKKALELWHKAAELGHSEAYACIGYAYDHGRGVEVDKKKATHYYELAAMGGDEISRYNLALDEKTAGNIDRALKHYMISARDGHSNSAYQRFILRRICNKRWLHKSITSLPSIFE